MEKSNLRIERKKRQRKENRQAIVRAAEQVILRKGYGAVTMDDIAGEAQYSKATVYRYFRNKGELLFEIMARYFDDLHESLAKIAAGDGPASEKLLASIRCVLDFHEEKSSVSRMVVMDPSVFRMMRVFFIKAPSQDPPPAKAFLDIVRRKKEMIYDVAAGVLREGMASGEFRDLDAPSALRFIDAAVQGYIHELFWVDDRDDARTAAEFLHTYILKGIGAGDVKRGKGEKR